MVTKTKDMYCIACKTDLVPSIVKYHGKRVTSSSLSYYSVSYICPVCGRYGIKKVEAGTFDEWRGLFGEIWSHDVSVFGAFHDGRI